MLYCGRLEDYQNRKEGSGIPRAMVAQLRWSIGVGLASQFLGTDHGA